MNVWAGRPANGRGRGQALVEFALIIPLVLIFLLVLIDFGRVIYAQNAITQDAREAARVATIAAQDNPITGTTCDPNSPPGSPSTYCKIRVAAVQTTPGVDLTAATITGAAGACIAPLPSDAAASATCFYPDGAVQGNRVVVRITTSVPLITGAAIAGLISIFSSNPPGGCFVSGSCPVTAQSVGYIQ